MAIHTPLDRDEIEAAAAAFGLGELVTFEGVPAGSINTSYVVKTSEGKYFLRLNEGKTPAAVEFELAVVRHLAAKGLPVPKAFPTHDGGFWIPIRHRPLSVFEYMHGTEIETPEEVTSDQARAVGAVLASIHTATRTFRADREGEFTLEMMAARIPAIRKATDDDDELAEVVQELETEEAFLRFAMAELGELPSGVVHGDLFPDNVRWGDDEIVAVIDFEMACTAPFVRDLATTQLAWLFDSSGTFRWEPLRAMGAGYEAVRPLTPRERDPGAWIWSRFIAWRYTVSRITDFHMSPLGPDRLVPKSFRRYFDRLMVLQKMTPSEWAEATLGK